MSDHLRILRHSLGFNENGSGREYRNYYAADPSDPDCKALVESGDMRRSHEIPGGLIYYRVTDQGRSRVLKTLPIPAKMTPAQRRYRRYIDADCGMKFGEWLKSQRKCRNKI